MYMTERGAWAEINLGAIAHNFRVIKSCIKNGAKLCAVVKANAYGHGAVPVARKALEAGAEYLAVATVPEALELREAGFVAPILLLGLAPTECADTIVAANITQTVCDEDFAEKISQAATRQKKSAKLHLKIDTGMGRIGIRPEEAGGVAKKIAALPNVVLEGIFSHFAAADTSDKTFSQKQIARFLLADENIKREGVAVPIKHIAESAAILSMPEAHFDMVRAGIIEYGLYPSDETKKYAGLKPAMKLCAEVLFVKTVAKGETIGYGCEFVAERESRIATLAIGYADGYIRAYKNFFAEVRGRRVPIAGRICMDQTMIDVTGVEGVRAGDTAILFGSKNISADDAARALNTINYEITCQVSNRVPRIYTEEQ